MYVQPPTTTVRPANGSGPALAFPRLTFASEALKAQVAGHPVLRAAHLGEQITLVARPSPRDSAHARPEHASSAATPTSRPAGRLRLQGRPV